jgi:hypothetical protein
MSVRRLFAVAALAASMLLYSCTSLVTAYLINQLLNDKAPKFNWSGTVQDTAGRPLSGVKVVVDSKVAGDTDIVTFSGETDSAGAFTISFRWSEEVDYGLKVFDQTDNLIYEQHIGKIPEGDRSSGITVQGAFTELSGVVRNAAGTPISGAAVVAATSSALGGVPTVLMNASSPAYAVTNDAGVFTLNGTISRYGIIGVFHPDYGFAYASGEDSDVNGQIPLNVTMGSNGRFDLNAQVVDGLGAPISNRVLEPAQQFRLVGKQPFNLSTTMDTVVEDNDLFPTLPTNPSVQQPPDFSFTVAATGANGMASGLQDVLGGSYNLTLLKVATEDLATAVVVGANPLVLAQDETVTVRVN